MIKIVATLDMPPSSNHIYQNLPGGGRTLSREARTWKRRATGEIVRQAKLGFRAADQFDHNSRWLLRLHFYFETITNKNYFEFYVKGPKKGQRKGQNRWKRMDLSNRIKIVEDSLKDASGIDDSSTFVQILIKDEDSERPRVEICLRGPLEEDDEE